jgi:hypothetical protein
MKIKPETKVGGIRLTLLHWSKLRELMVHHQGRAWLERIIDREHRKVQK